MKICFFAAANSAHSYRWIRYFVDKGHQVSWVSLTPASQNIEKTEFYDIGPWSRNPFRIFTQIKIFKKLVRRIKPDILHIHSAGTYGLIGTFPGLHPSVVTAWGSEVLFATGIKKMLVSNVLKKSDLITCDADHMLNAIMKLGVKNEKIKKICFGVEMDIFRPGEKDGNIVKSLKLDDFPVVISLRNLEPLYDVETLIRSIPKILKDIPGIKFIIAGKGIQEDYLKELAGSLGIQDKVIFLGRYSHKELPNYLRTSDIYVSTSLSDAGIAASTAEAMGCGIPVIITDSGENNKWINDGENGYLIPLKSPKILAERIIELCRNRDLRKRLGEAGRRTIEEKNNYHTEMGKMEILYEGLIKYKEKK